jgi:hypothetical protein
MGFEGFNPVENSDDRKLEEAEKRLEKAREALGKIGPENFADLIEKGDPVAVEYAEALKAYNKTAGTQDA